MRRKDVLIISSVIVVIMFLIVSVLYYSINKTSIFDENKTAGEQYYENGWEQTLVSEIKNNVPIPVGFTYIEGNKKTGIIIKNNVTEEQYMWVPYNKKADITYEEVLELGLQESGVKEKESIEKYNGFYVAVDDRSLEEKFDEYLKENTGSFDEYYKLKQSGYEEYKKLYKEATGREFNINEIRTEKVKDNDTKTSITETHTMSVEEFASAKVYIKNLEKDIKLKDLKTLTINTSVLGKSNEKNEEEIDKEICEKVIDKNNKIVYIPKGFEYQTGTVDSGFTIKNRDNLTFIWIPVELSEDEKEKDLREVIRERFNKKLIEHNIDKEAYPNKYTDNLDNDIDRKKYEELEKSIKKYGGFYISEAELGYDENGISINTYRDMYNIYGEEGYNYVSNGDYYRNVKKGNIKEGSKVAEKQKTFKLTYDTAKKTCENLYGVSESVVSHLTYGLEYDATILYLLEQGKKTDGERLTAEELFNNSTDIGKYKDSNPENYIKKGKIGLNGIYGLAGNLEEITMERDGENVITRGGYWKDEGNHTTLTSKVSESLSNIEKDEDRFGIRACIYIKTEYEDVSEKLQKVKDEAIDGFKKYIDSISIQADSKEYFNNNYKNEEYENLILNNIYKYTEDMVQKEISSTVIEKLVQEGKDEVDKLKNNINKILNYPIDIKDYTYGETKEKCLKIKTNAINEMDSWIWEKGILKNKEGKGTKYQDIIEDVKDKIKEVRTSYKDNMIKEYIESVENVEGEAKELKNKLIEELKYIEDLDNYKKYCGDARKELEDFINNPKAEEYNYVVLGDSIAYGYLVKKNERYADLLKNHISQKEAKINYTNLAVTGWDTNDLLNAISNKNYNQVGRKNADYANATYSTYYDALKEADLITISIGSNDLLGVLTGQLSKIFGMNSTDLTPEKIKNKIQELINNKDISGLTKILTGIKQLASNLEDDLDNGVNVYGEKWPQILNEIKNINNKAQIVVTEFYNPYYDVTGISIESDKAKNLADLTQFYIDILNKILYEQSNNQSNYQIAKINSSFVKGSNLTNVKFDFGFDLSNIASVVMSGKDINDLVDIDIDPHPNKKRS